MKMLTLLALALCASCNGIPKDPDRTLDRVRAERQYKVGIIASGEPIGADRQRLFLSRVSAASQARPALEVGAAEPLLAKLEEGELDLVLGPMAAHSPWSKLVTFLPPLGEQVTSEGHVHLVAAARHGENAWISLLDREAAKVAAIR
jgi:hypothetical protein